MCVCVCVCVCVGGSRFVLVFFVLLLFCVCVGGFFGCFFYLQFVFCFFLDGMEHGNRIYVSTYFESFGHASSRAQPLAWPVTLSAAGLLAVVTVVLIPAELGEKCRVGSLVFVYQLDVSHRS